jgi:hypothetical protein
MFVWPTIPDFGLSFKRTVSKNWAIVQSQMIDAMVRLEQAVVPYLQRWLEED